MTTRRTVLLSGAGVAGALVVGWGLLPARGRLGDAGSWPATPPAIALNGWIKVTEQGRVQLAMPRCEMGQGIHTALSMLVAEEMDVPLAFVAPVSAGLDALYGNLGVWLTPLPWQPPTGPAGAAPASPANEGRRVRLSRWLRHKSARQWGLQLTTGSSSVMDAWDDLRLAAATARMQLLRAASLRWRQPVDELRVNQGIVSHANGSSAHYGELAAVAAITRPGEVNVKPSAQWTLIGRPAPRVLATEPLRPPARFGMDLRWPDLVFAAVRHAPAHGGGVGEVAVDAVLRLPGVERVVHLRPWAGSTAGVAVVARSTWHALRAARALTARWQAPAGGSVDTDRILVGLQAQALSAAQADGVVFGGAEGTSSSAKHEALYTVPYLGHAVLEPTHATAQVHNGQVTVWAPTQSPTTARALAARVAGVAENAVQLHVLPAGGSFGRRMDTEVIGQAVQVALETAGRPVQLVWSRQEDLAHDFHRPAQATVLQAMVDVQGWPLSWSLHSAGDAATPRWLARQLPQATTRWAEPSDGLMGEGWPTLPYAVPTRTARHVATHSGVPVGPWRSGPHVAFAFASECFIDELAHRGGHDPLAYRLQLLAQQPACVAVLKLAADKAGWGQRLPPGTARGLAFHVCAHSLVAMVAEVRATPGRAQVQVQRVVCVADVGTVVHPEGVARQLEGGLVYGLNAALWGQVDIQASQVRVTEWDAGRQVTLAHTPRIETHLVRSSRAPGGVGAVATPVIAPAVANAWFALTGQRVRRLPMNLPVVPAR
ncbi:MAG: molybdopterin cofactor-binding domain-containing protein [Pseudomonadota bacterium]